MLIFQIKKIISSGKWFNYVVTFFFENAKNLGRSDDAKRREKKRMALNFYRQCDSHEEALLLALFILTKYRQKGHMTNHFPAAVTFSESQDFLLQILKNEDLKNIERSQQRQRKR